MHVRENNKYNKPCTKKTFFTKRETDIVILICKEFSNKQIAGELKISPHTVETHKKSIRTKTKSFTIVGVALYAARNNIFMHALAFIFPSFIDVDCCEIFFSVAGVPLISPACRKPTHCRSVFPAKKRGKALQLSNHQQRLGSYELNKAKLTLL